MVFIINFIVLFYIIQFSYISNSLQPQVVHLINSGYLLINRDVIFRFIIDNLNQNGKVPLLEEDQNLLANQNNNQNIYRFKCFEEDICIFWNSVRNVGCGDGTECDDCKGGSW